MLGVKEDDAADMQAKALTVLADRVHAAEAGEHFEAPVGWGTQISADELAAFNSKKAEPKLLSFEDLDAMGFGPSASSPSELQPTD